MPGGVERGRAETGVVHVCGFALTSRSMLKLAAALVFIPVLVDASPLDDSRVAADAAPKDANAQFNYGLALMTSIEPQLRSGQLEDDDKKVAAEADKAYERAIKVAPNHGRAQIMLGMLCNFTKQYERAIPHLRKGMQLPKDSSDWFIAADTLINVYFNQNKPAPAVPVLEQIVKQRPSDANAHYKLGLAYMFTQKRERAKTELERTLELQPDHADARKQLATL
ncbi:MAG: tetratricopeptide repeat protein [Clostridia bacterium]|nr:tetratricopeptide repeat protein [Deltaproteobacteria bacterium]